MKYQKSEQARLEELDVRVKTFAQLAAENGVEVEEAEPTNQSPLVRERRPMKSKKEVKKELEQRRSGKWLMDLD